MRSRAPQRVALRWAARQSGIAGEPSYRLGQWSEAVSLLVPMG